MNIKGHRIVPFLAAFLVLAVVQGVKAQEPKNPAGGLLGTLLPEWLVGPPGQEFPFQVTGEVEAGGRLIEGERSSSNFEEYREIPSGLFLDHLLLSIESKKGLGFAEFRAREAAEEDQSFGLRFGSLGRVEVDLGWDQIPHVFSNTGRTLYTQPSEDVFQFPDSLQSAIQNATDVAPPAGTVDDQGRILRDGLANAQPVELRFRQDTGTVGAKFSPNPDWTFGVRFLTSRKDGTMPLGVGFGSPGGTVVEIASPIETRTSEATASVEFAKERYQVQFGYTASIFENDFPSVILDNPLRATDSPTAGSSRGQIALPPDNIAHTFNLSGGLTLPMRSRLIGTFSVGWRFQDEDFLPHTINSSLEGDSALVLPAQSPDAEVRTLVGNIVFTSRLLKNVSLNARYRIFNLDNNTPVFTFPGHVVNDQTLVLDPRRNVPHEYTKQNSGADVSFRPFQPLSLKVGYDWERWDWDDAREVTVTNEHTVKGVADVTPWSWLLVRGSYAKSWKDGGAYNTFAHLAHTLTTEEALEEEIPAFQFPGLRKLDEADRVRDKVLTLAQITPFETLSLTASYSFAFDDYPSTSYGVTKGENWSASIDAVYSIFPWLSLFADYTREEFKTEQRSRNRPVTGTTTFDFQDFDWVSKNIDIVDTFGVGLDATLLPKRLDLRLGYSLSIAEESIDTFNPITPTSGTPAQDTAATAGQFPSRLNWFHQLTASLWYHLTKHLSTKLGYRYERYLRQDFAIENIQPYMGQPDIPGDPTRATRDVFLGADVPNYEAHIIEMALRYKF